jgi:hypothetical protein
MKRLQRPIVIPVLTILIVICYGIVPFLTAFPVLGRRFVMGALPFNGSVTMLYNDQGEAPIVLVFVSLFLCVFTLASAVWASFGPNESRIATLAFVTTNFLWWNFLVVNVIAKIEAEDPFLFELIESLMVPPFLLGCIWWNFTRPEVVAYYKQQSELS